MYNSVIISQLFGLGQKRLFVFLGLLSLLCFFTMGPATADQEKLKPILNAGKNLLKFDWPIIRIGTGEYQEGPTGVTVFHFGEKVLGAVDVRGGAPGTVNAAYMQLGYDVPEVDAVVFSGGSWYGLETATAVANALREDGLRDANAFNADPNIALSVGSIIYDFGARRLNEIVPDKRLAQAAFRAARPGVFPQGAQGAGRMAMSGYFFRCDAKAGQGGAYREVGAVKIATFVVVNAIGAVTDREGNLVACNRDPSWPADVTTNALMEKLSDIKQQQNMGIAPDGHHKNTTVSLVVTNQKLSPAELKRLAAQVHTSMGRGLQPFATQFDGDVLYAISTAELEESVLTSAEIGAIASEVMWDAILASVPEQPKASSPDPTFKISEEDLEAYIGTYTFSENVSLQIKAKDGILYGKATGGRAVFAIGTSDYIELLPVKKREFMVPGRYPFLMRFEDTGTLVLNPGHWEQRSK